MLQSPSKVSMNRQSSPMIHLFFYLDNFADLSSKTRMYIEKHHLEYASRPGGVFNKQTQLTMNYAHVLLNPSNITNSMSSQYL